DMPQHEALEEEVWHDLQPMLDRELSRLPDKYRVPVVLCDLEGKSRKEVARQLRLPEGTISSRLARGRRLLAGRLNPPGVGLSAGALAAMLRQQAASACVPAPLVAHTVQAATLIASGKVAAGVLSAKVAALTEGVLKAMFLAKLKIATVVLLAVA